MPAAATGEVDGRERAKLRWRCRRGMRELDVLLLRYLEHDYPAAAAAEREAFRRILDLQDPELFGYLVGRTTPTEEPLRAVIATIRQLAP